MGKAQSESAKQIESIFFLGQAASEIVNEAKKIVTHTGVELECAMNAIELAIAMDCHNILREANAIERESMNRKYPNTPIIPTDTPPTGECNQCQT